MGDRSAWGEFCPSGADRPKVQARGGLPSLINATWGPGTLLFTPTTLRTGQLLRSQESLTLSCLLTTRQNVSTSTQYTQASPTQAPWS